MTVVAGDDALDSIVDIPTVRGRVFPVVGCGAVSVSHVEIVVVTARVVKDGAERECVEIVGRDFELAPEKECKEENALDARSNSMGSMKSFGIFAKK